MKRQKNKTIVTNRSFEDEIDYIDGLLCKFTVLKQDYPKADFNRIISELQQDRAELANKIGRRKP